MASALSAGLDETLDLGFRPEVQEQTESEPSGPERVENLSFMSWLEAGDRLEFQQYRTLDDQVR